MSIAGQLGKLEEKVRKGSTKKLSDSRASWHSHCALPRCLSSKKCGDATLDRFTAIHREHQQLLHLSYSDTHPLRSGDRFSGSSIGRRRKRRDIVLLQQCTRPSKTPAGKSLACREQFARMRHTRSAAVSHSPHVWPAEDARERRQSSDT